MEEIRVETERLRQEAEERVAQMRLEVAENLEPTRSVKNEIIEKQDALIGLLYREEDASPEIRELKREVESKKAVLQKQSNQKRLFCKSGVRCFPSCNKG